MIYLSSQNFNVVGNPKRTLRVNVDGNLLVFFKMESCGACSQFLPIFNQFSSQENKVKCAIADISQDRNIINMSRSTTTPINAVPFIVLYVNGAPLAKYNGQRTITAMKSFLAKALGQHQNQTQQNNNFMSNYQQKEDYSSQNYYSPEMGNNPQAKFRGDGHNYSGFVDEEDDDEEKLLMPTQVTPHNVPWESSYKKMGNLDQ